MTLLRFHLIALGSLFYAAAAQGQYELKSGNFNSIFVAQTAAGTAATASGPPVVSSPPPTAGQFSAMGQVAGGTGPLSSTSVYADRYPFNPGKTLILARATIGGVFASGVSRYSLGDVIKPPLAAAVPIFIHPVPPAPALRSAGHWPCA